MGDQADSRCFTCFGSIFSSRQRIPASNEDKAINPSDEPAILHQPTEVAEEERTRDLEVVHGMAPSIETSLARIFESLAVNEGLKSTAAEKLAQLAAELEGGKGSRQAADSNGVAPSLKLPQGSEVDVEPVERLKRGFLRFKEQYFKQEKALFTHLSKTQTPKVMVIACADSRVSPDVITGAHLGELFIVRNVANLVPAFDAPGQPSVSAAMEYAVKHLGVENIIVMGHRACGGIKALVTLPDEVVAGASKGSHDFVEDWVKIGLPARSKTLDACKGEDVEAQCRFCEKVAVNHSLTNLLTFPWIKEKASAGKLALHGWYYDFVDGYLDTWTLKVETSTVQRISN